uniref:DUF1618 domain-containing protein n=1 Tax=Aegilops tauschii TaxID=37682 RepID=N1QQC7_AEGTA
MAVRFKKWPFSEYYIYHTDRDHGGDGRPELYQIQQPNSMRLVNECCAVGLVSHGGGYHVAALAIQENGEFLLYIFSSETRAWTIKKPVLSLADGATDLGDYMPDKAIASVMAVSWRSSTCGMASSSATALPARHELPVATSSRHRLRHVQRHNSHQEKGWQQGFVLYDHELLVADGVSTDGLLPEVSELAETKLANLLVDMPMLSLHENNIICLLAKHHMADSEVWSIAVDMEMKKLKGVNLLQVGRCTTLFYSTISSHLNMTAAASGEKECPKRPGTQLESYPHKKQQQQLSMMSSAVGEQEQDAMGAPDGDEDNV